jgi:hypothetical protein
MVVLLGLATPRFGEGLAIVEGPVQIPGAREPITSVYFNDPYGSLIEMSRYDGPAPNAS